MNIEVIKLLNAIEGGETGMGRYFETNFILRVSVT